MLKLLDSLKMRRIGSGDHPLENLREADRIYAELRAGDPMKSIEEITDWLESLDTVESVKLERRFAVVRQLDDIAQPHRARLAREQGSAPRQARPQEARLWSATHDYWLRVAASYDNIIGRIEAKEKGAEAMRKECWHVAVRALRAFCMRLRLLYLRYGPIPAEIWGGLAHAYRFAEARGLHQARAVAYPGSQAETAPEEEFMRALLLAASAPDALTPPELDVTERVIAAIASKFHLTSQPNPDSTYWFDLDAPRQPLRLAAPPAQLTPGLRFFATASGYSDVQQMLQRLEKTAELPRGVELGAMPDTRVVGEVLRHLRVNWAPRPPVRRTERKRARAQMPVVHGLENILGLFHPTEVDLDFGGSSTETWTLENMSGGGFGATVPHAEAEWLHIGSLVAAQPDSASGRWDVGVVRRLAREDGQRGQASASAGVQLLSREAMAGVFTTNLGRWANGVPTVTGIVVPESGESGSILVILPSGLYLPGEQLLAMIAERRHLLFPVGLVESGDDYDVIKFRALVQEG